MIALIGLPGSGKTTIGRHLARRIGVPFVDSDQCIEQRLGGTIRDYFARAGEAAFRDIEESVIDTLTASRRGVLSTGGGVVLRAANREHLQVRSHVVYLHSTPEDVYRRVRHDASRPLLQVDDPMARLRELYAQRDPLYRETAQFVVETGRPSVSMLVNRLLMQLELAGVLPLATAAPASAPDA